MRFNGIGVRPRDFTYVGGNDPHLVFDNFVR